MLSRLSWVAGAAALLAAAPAAAADGSALSNGCFAVGGIAVHVEPTDLDGYLLSDAGGRLLDGRLQPLGGPEAAGPAAEWTRAGDLALRPPGGGAPMALTPAQGCTPFPEAELGASGTPSKGKNRDGTVSGFADTHLHVTADMRAGGAVMGGKAFDRFGIARALGGDAHNHGADGGLDYTGNLLRDGVPFGTHDTAGWPTFSGWPTHDTNTHQQTYHVWLQRAWLAGLRLIVAHTVEDTQICKLQPRRAYSCDETRAVKGQIGRLRGLERHVDAQAGGPGRGWFRLVYSPRQARRVIERGKLAVVIGMETSFPLGCRAQRGRPRCTNAQVDRRLDAVHRMGVRSLFIAHWADNGFAGAALQGGTKGKFINAMHRVEVGRYFETEACAPGVDGEVVEALSDLEIDVLSDFFPATAALASVPKPTYPPEPRCNARGLTRLGAHLVRRMMDRHMLIEVDHLSQKARERVLEIAEARRYPLVSGHNETGGSWNPSQLRRLHALGGIASQTSAGAAELLERILARERYRTPGHYFGVGLGTDTGGFNSLPGPSADAAADPLPYPFRVDGGPVEFMRQRTGERVFDLNTDGVAHYGLIPDLLADVERRPRGTEAIDLLFRSAESYLQMWELAGRRG